MIIYPPTWKGGNENVTGYLVEVMGILQQKLRFRFEYVPSVDGFWGAKDENGTWNGMVGMLHRGQADICGAALTESAVRFEARTTDLSFFSPLTLALPPS